MLRIQVLGHGMIPRGLGLAPHRQLFWADKLLIQTILTDSRLSINMQHPVDGRLIPLNRTNLDKLWDSYSDKYDTVNTSNKVKTEVIGKPKTLIDKNNEKNSKGKNTQTIIVEEPKKSEAEVKTIEELKKAGMNVANDKQFDTAIEKAINNTSIDNKKVESFKTENAVKNDQKKNDNKKEEAKKEDKKNETILHPINNPDNK